MSEGGVSGSEVVDRYPYAELLDGGESVSGLLGVTHEGRLGDLNRQRRWVQAALGERALYVGYELVGVELASGHVDGHSDGISGLVPSGALRAGLLENPLADLDDHPRLLEQRDKIVRLNDAASRVPPADQGLHSGGAHIVQVDCG